MAPRRTLGGGLWRTLSAARPIRIPEVLVWVGLAVVMFGGAIYILDLGDGTTFWGDDWGVIFTRRGGGLSPYLDPYFGNPSMIPVAAFKFLFVTVGLTDYLPYRATVLALHLICVLCVFLIARRRVPDVIALAGAVAIMFLGSGWEDILWPIQISYLGSMAAGLGAILMLDRQDRLGDWAAGGLLVLSLASSSHGIAFAAGALVEVLWQREHWRRRVWVAAVPLGLWVLWYAGFALGGPGQALLSNLPEVPRYMARQFRADLNGLTGTGYKRPAEFTTASKWIGSVLVVASVAYLVTRLVSIRGRSVRFSISPRMAMLITMPLVMWFAAAISRAQYPEVAPTRYVYPAAVFMLLIAVELARGIKTTPKVLAVTAIALVISLFGVPGASDGNLGALRFGADSLRSQAGPFNAQQGAADIARDVIPRDMRIAWSGPIEIIAGPYLAAVDELGSPGYTEPELRRAPEKSREAADDVLIRAQRISLQAPAQATPARGAAPRVDAATGEVSQAAGSCLRFEPLSSGGALELTLPERGLLVTALGDARTSLRLRRFGSRFANKPVGSVAGSSRTLQLRPDRSQAAWHVQASGAQPLRVCAI